MTTTSSQPATAEEQPPVAGGGDESPTRAVGVASLISGRSIQFPVYDAEGVLLLAEGSVITTRFKELLVARQVTEVYLREEDVNTVTLDGIPACDAGEVDFDPQLTEKLDSIIDSGDLFVANSGESLCDKMVLQGCKAYDPEERQRVITTHRNAGEALDGIMQEALRGGDVNGKQLAETTGNYLTAVMSDVDCVLNTVLEVGEDAALADHCLKMSLLGMAIGIEMELNEENVRTLGLCGLVHDWGMVRVPEAIRKAERLLSAVEFVAIERHPIYSLELLEKVVGLPGLVPLVAYQVHERCNGSGYPRGRQQEEIHLFARILAVADSYLALTSPRPYRAALMPYAGMECLITLASQRCFDVAIVRALLRVMALFPIGSYVVLNDGHAARVMRRSGNEFARPIVKLIAKPDGTSLEDESSLVDLSDSADLHVVQALPTPGKTELTLSPDIVKPLRPTG
jgi:HD-GYP domain-containing protein (c-di-GMP phosphodiesterase class II)